MFRQVRLKTDKSVEGKHADLAADVRSGCRGIGVMRESECRWGQAKSDRVANAIWHSSALLQQSAD